MSVGLLSVEKVYMVIECDRTHMVIAVLADIVKILDWDKSVRVQRIYTQGSQHTLCLPPARMHFCVSTARFN